MMKRNIYLDGLRGVATLAIFLFHAGLLLEGTFPVTLFFMMSGFLIYLNKYDKADSITLKDNVKYVLSKLKKWYPIHLLTFIASIFIRIDMISKLSITENIINAFLNLFLIQAFFPNKVLSYNTLSWYLSATIFLYLISFVCVKFVKNRNNIVLVLIMMLQIFLGTLPNLNSYLYFSPFYRITDLVLGMYAAKNYKRINQNSKLSLLELLIMILFGLQYVLSLKIGHVGPQYYSILFFCILIIVPYGKGIVSKIITYKPFILLAKISFPFYMVHQLILVLINKIITFDFGHWVIHNLIIAIPAFIISYMISIRMNKISCKYC